MAARRKRKPAASNGEQRGAAKWKKAIGEALRVEKTWRKDADRLVKRYREEDRTDSEEALGDECGSRFNILYANLAVLKPAIFQNAPRPDVRRRYDPEGNDEQSQAIREIASKASTVLERGLTHQIDEGGFEEEANDFIQDALLPGRGVLRIRYKPELIEEPVTDPTTGTPLLDENEEPVTSERVIAQYVCAEHVYWKDFLVAPYRKWSRVDRPPWIAFRHLMTRADLREHFGNGADGVPTNWSPDTGDDKDKALGEGDRAEIWEVWDYRERKVHWIAMGHNAVIDSVDDPLGLSDFYPCPRPFYAARTTDTLVPIAEYRMYADQAAELDEITGRISILTRELKVRGLYDAGEKGVAELIEAGDGEMIPIESFAVQQGRKLEDLILFWPVEKIIQVLVQLHVQREQVKQTIFEIMGISDILRGSSNPNETLGAQRIKSQFGTLRIDERRREANRVMRDALRIMAEIIAEKFEPDILMRMTGVEIDEKVVQLLRNESARGFMIDIESDSTVAPDELAEQEAVTKLLAGVTTFIQGVAPIVQQGMLTGRQALEILRFAIRPFRGARMLENVLDEAERTLNEAEQQPAQPEPPDPEQAKQQAETERAQLDAKQAQIDQQANEAMRDLDLKIKQMAVDEAEAKALHGERIRELEEQKAQIALAAAAEKRRQQQRTQQEKVNESA